MLKIFQFLSKWEITVNGDTVTIYIPKFRTLLDEYTLKKLSKISGQCRDSVGTMSSLDKDKDKDIPLTPKRGTSKRRPRGVTLSPDQEEKFNRFYSAYPKKVAKQEAIKAWMNISPENGLYEKIITALEVQKESRDWIRDDGQYIPNPATWLNGKRWDDGTVEVPRRPTW